MLSNENNESVIKVTVKRAGTDIVVSDELISLMNKSGKLLYQKKTQKGKAVFEGLCPGWYYLQHQRTKKKAYLAQSQVLNIEFKIFAAPQKKPDEKKSDKAAEEKKREIDNDYIKKISLFANTYNLIQQLKKDEMQGIVMEFESGFKSDSQDKPKEASESAEEPKENIVNPDKANVLESDYGSISIRTGLARNMRTRIGEVWFQLIQDNNVIAKGRTDSNGILSFGELKEGNYVVQMVMAPQEYLLNSTPLTISVKSCEESECRIGLEKAENRVEGLNLEF